MTHNYFAGIDVGSLSTDAVILNDRGEVLGYSIISTGASSTEAAEAAFEKALDLAGVHREQIKEVVATGYGRVSVPFAHKTVTEISCHSLGAYTLFPDTGTVIDIGGQDSKVIRVGPEGKVLDFTMNDKCAAGTGRFLEVMAAKLRISLDEMGGLSLKGQKEARISTSALCLPRAKSSPLWPGIIPESKSYEAFIGPL